MEDLAPFIEGGRVAPWDAQGIPHRVKRGKVELLMPRFYGVVDPSSQKQADIAEALIRKLRGESGGWGDRLNELGGYKAFQRYKYKQPLKAPW